MSTQEKTKQEMLRDLREKREKREARMREKKQRRYSVRIAALLTLAAMVTVIFGTVYNASAKEITITEIDEFMGVNETKTVKTRSERVEGVLEEHGVDIGDADKLNVSVQQTVKDNEDIVIKRGKRIKVKVGEHERTVAVTKADVTEALVEAGYIPGEYDSICADGDKVSEGDTIELVSVSLTEESMDEKIERGVEYKDDPTLPVGQEKVVDEGQDGIRKIVFKVTYRGGEEETREILSEEITSEARNKVIARGCATMTPVIPKKTVSEENGGSINGYKYKKKITMTATAYSTSPSENGGGSVSAMGNPLRYGIVAVDPSVVPLGSKVYVAAADGSWTYGVASAEDTGGAIKGNKIDLCYDSGSDGFGRRSCVVYVLE